MFSRAETGNRMGGEDGSMMRSGQGILRHGTCRTIAGAGELWISSEGPIEDGSDKRAAEGRIMHGSGPAAGFPRTGNIWQRDRITRRVGIEGGGGGRSVQRSWELQLARTFVFKDYDIHAHGPYILRARVKKKGRGRESIPRFLGQVYAVNSLIYKERQSTSHPTWPCNIARSTID